MFYYAQVKDIVTYFSLLAELVKFYKTSCPNLGPEFINENLR